ncbi:MAG: cation diffusion facilitator family transporter [Paludibacteraceae bacterium]|nr:cation diffusion facilitator family transporter [Paludibacteraceae bacterium]
MANEVNREKEIYKLTLWGSLVNFLLLVFKFVAGFVGNSAAMIADAVHSLSDFITDIIVILFVRVSSMPKDENHHYGHGKYETLATAIIGVVLFTVGVGILVNAVETIIDFFHGKELAAPNIWALGAAAVSIVFKEALYQYTVYKGKNLNSNAVMANAWHHRSDALSSIGTLLGISGAMFLGEKWRVLDPIAAFLVSIFILKVAIELTKTSLEELLEKSLPKKTQEKILNIIHSFPEVKSPHNLRTRHIGSNIAIEFHIRMDGNLSLNEVHEITKRMENALKAEFGPLTHIGIHMEPINHEKEAKKIY